VEEKKTEIVKPNSRSYRLDDAIWPEFEARAEAIAKDWKRVSKGDVVSAIMWLFLRFDNETQEMLVKAFCDRASGAEVSDDEMKLSCALMSEIGDAARSERGRRRKGKRPSK